jgi:putative ABC transport system permease protein
LARDVNHTNLYESPRPEVYRPHEQAPSRSMMLVARGRTSTHGVAAAIRSAVYQVDREQPVFRLQSVEAVVTNRQSGERATTKVLGFLAMIALVLAAIGTYGVMAYTAAQRVREIGIRLALGATRADVFRLQMKGGLILAVLGLAIGLPAAYGVTPLLRAIGSALDARDAAAYTGVALALFAVALVASIIPAWRAMRVDPSTVLRNE